MEYTLNCNGKLLSLEKPVVMGILNVTSDSFYAESRQRTAQDIAARARRILSEGGSVIDVGACSTRPDGALVSESDEMARLRQALGIVRRESPHAIVSVDTFRPDVARMAVEEYGADIINDVGAPADSTLHTAHSTLPMFRMVSRLRVPYIYTSHRAAVGDVMLDCAEAVDTLRSLGQKDIILDPGFGFGKTMAQNYAILSELERMQALALPLLVGVSRKSMIYRLLDTDPSGALNGTTALNTIALTKGASIVRVHDVREAVECVRIVAAISGEVFFDEMTKELFDEMTR